MTAQPQTKSNLLIDEIAQLFSGEKQIDALTLLRIKKEVGSVLKIDAAKGHNLLGMVACFELDLPLCKKHHESSIRLADDDNDYAVYAYANYINSLLHFGLSNDAYQQVKKALNKFSFSPALIILAIETAIYSGHPADVEDYYRRLGKIQQNIKDIKANHFKSIADKFKQAEITDDTACLLIKFADSLVFKNGLHCVSKYAFTDDESNMDIFYFVEIDADPAKVVEMNMELCEQIANDPYFCDKNTFSIAYQSR
jgi:hypothetical protein